jgi:competence transcription factor ComK
MSEKMKEIRALENKYGLVLFRMGLTHLFDVGYKNFSDEVVADTIKVIMEKGVDDKASGKIPIMTPEFQCEILRCAAELTEFSIWTLFAYIKRYVNTD